MVCANPFKDKPFSVHLKGATEDNTFLQLGPQESDTRETFIKKFVNLVNEYNLHKVVVLEETDEDEIYKFIY